MSDKIRMTFYDEKTGIQFVIPHLFDTQTKLPQLIFEKPNFRKRINDLIVKCMYNY